MRSPESVVNSRFFIHPAGTAPSPGNCACCGTVERPLVDFGMSLDYYGAVLLCTLCISEAAESIGVGGENSPQTQVTVLPPHVIGKIHEYLGATLDATNRLISVLPDSDFSPEVSEEDSGSDDEGDDGIIRESSVNNDPLAEPFSL